MYNNSLWIEVLAIALVLMFAAGMKLQLTTPTLLLVLAGGCADEPTATDELAAELGHRDDDTSARSGSRLRARFFEGLGAREFAFFEDRKLGGARCAFDVHADGEWRCLPGTEGIYYVLSYLDADCTQPFLFESFPGEFAGAAEEVAGSYVHRAGRLGAEVDYTAEVYQRVDGQCTPAEGFEPGVGRRWTEIPGHRLARATEQVIPRGGRLGELVLRGDDGSQVYREYVASDEISYSGRHTFVDRSLGDAVVNPTLVQWREAFRGKVAWAGPTGWRDATHFSDASCETPLFYEYTGDPEAVGRAERVSPSCTVTGELHELVPAEQAYASEGGTCSAVSDYDGGAETLGGSVEDRYLRGTIAPAPGHGRFSRLEVKSNDGSRVHVSWFDRATGLPCDWLDNRDGTASCSSWVNTEGFRFYTDAACTHHVVTLDATAIEARDCYAGPAPRFLLADEDGERDGQVTVAVAGARLPLGTFLYLSSNADGSDCQPLNDAYAAFEIASETVVSIPRIPLR
jgi:hypothetical protein